MPPVSRKRSRHDGSEDNSRPSPHRPDQLDMNRQRNPQDSPYRHSPSQHNSHNHPHANSRGAGRRARGGGRGRSVHHHQSHGDLPFESRLSHANEPTPNPPGDSTQTSRPGSSSAPAPQDQATQQQKTSSHTNNTSSQPAPPPELVAVKVEPRPCLYELLTDDCIENWSESGRASIMKQLTESLAANDYLQTSSIYQELIRAGLDLRIQPDEAGEFVKEALASSPADDLDGATLFLDTITVLSEMESDHPNLKMLVFATGISPDLMREVLEGQMLINFGLVRNTFMRMFARKNTNSLYRQSNYNLLREESEGYSKLITDLYEISTTRDVPASVAEETFQKVLALIGSFSLDAGRVLDVTLDLFASLLVKHFRFFVKYLRSSSYWPKERLPAGDVVQAPLISSLPSWALPDSKHWMTEEEEKLRLEPLRAQRDVTFWERAREIGIDAFFELDGRKILDSEAALVYVEADQANDTARGLETRQWIQETKTLPPIGNQVAAQLLGFKLRFYASQNRDASDVLPENLIYLSAMLIKIGFISLRDLYTHLYPEDESMEQVREKKQKEKDDRDEQERGGGVMNALARAGALADDTLPAGAVARVRESDAKRASSPRADSTASTNEVAEAELLPEPADQKIELLKSLLCIGALPEALYLLGRFPWLHDLVQELPAHLHRILHHQLSKICEVVTPLFSSSPIADDASAAELKEQVQTGQLSPEHAKWLQYTSRRTLKWAKLDANGVDGGNDYRFYWDEALDSIPVCQTIDDVFTLCKTLLSLSGVKIGQDAALLAKLIRIARHSLREDFSDNNQARWLDLLKRLICPAFSLTEANSPLAYALFEVLSMFPIQARYSIYGEWFQGATSRNPDVRAAFKDAEYKTRSLMKRMSTSTQKQTGRALAKVACSCPGIVFNYALSQIESYSNLAPTFITSVTYLNSLGYDVFTWSLLSTIGRSGRSKVKDTGYEASEWLISLSSFIGQIFKEYHQMDPLPMLQYILDRLRREDYMDLLVLKELITHMAGIIPETNLSDFQTRCLSGGPKLRAYTFWKIQDKRHLRKREMERLVRALVKNNLAGSFAVSIAQARQDCINNTEQTSLKVISESFDDISEIFSQFTELLYSNLPITEVTRLLPDLKSLIVDFGLQPAIAFFMHRRGIRQAVKKYDEERTGDPQKAIAQEEAEDTDMQDASAINDDPVPAAGDGDTEMADLHDGPIQTCHPIIKELSESLLPVLGEDLHATVNVEFFTTFWSLNPGDVFFDESSYENVMRQSKERTDEIGREIGRLLPGDKERKKELEKERQWLIDIRPHFKPEKDRELASFKRVNDRLVQEKAHWFSNVSSHWQQIHEALWQHCLLPRLLLSPLDSYFCWQMIWFLHSQATPKFSTMHLLNIIFSANTLQNLIFQCTAREIENLGRFVYQVLQKLNSWQSNEALYKREALGENQELRGFAKRIRDGKPVDFLDFNSFRGLHLQWHKQVEEALFTCIQPQGEYMHMKNAISFAKCIGDYWPRVDSMGEKMLTLAQELHEDERPSTKESVAWGLERGDLSVALASLKATLARSKPKWIPTNSFRTGEKPPPKKAQPNGRAAAASASAASAAASTATAKPSAATKLNAEAPTFEAKASVRPDAASDLKTKPSTKVTIPGKAEVEDGELADSPVINRDNSGNQQDKVTDIQQLRQKALAARGERATAPARPASSAETRGNEPTRPSPAPPRLPEAQRDVRDSTPRQERSEGRRAPLPPQRPPVGLGERSDRGRQAPMGAPGGRPPYDNRNDSRNRLPDTSGRPERPHDLMADRERPGASPGRLAGGPSQDRPLYRDDSRNIDRTGRPHADERRIPPREGLYRDSSHEQLRQPERPSRYDETRRDGGGRLSPRGPSEYARGTATSGASASGEASGINPARAALIEQASTHPLPREPHPSGRSSQPRSRQPTPPGERIQRQRAERAQGEQAEMAREGRTDTRDERLDQARVPPFEAPRDRTSEFAIPNGPRGSGRQAQRGYDEPPPRGGPAARGGPDLGSGRYEGPRTQDPNYGRLQREPPSPTGPRGPRNFNNAESNAAPERTRSNTVNDSAPPQGPAKRTSERYQQPAIPTTPEGTGIHPSRLTQIEGDGRATRSAGQPPPLGPRSGQQRGQAQAFGVSNGPPTAAPAGPADDRRAGDSRRQYQGVQDTLAQGAPSNGLRGRESSGNLRGRPVSNGGGDFGHRGPSHGGMPPGPDGREAYGGDRRGPGEEQRPRGPAPQRNYRDSMGSGGGRDLMDEGRHERGRRDDGSGGGGSMSGRKRDFPSDGQRDHDRNKRTRRGGHA